MGQLWKIEKVYNKIQDKINLSVRTLYFSCVHKLSHKYVGDYNSHDRNSDFRKDLHLKDLKLAIAVNFNHLSGEE